MTTPSEPADPATAAPAATHRPRFPLWVAIVAGGAITAVSLGVRSTFGLLLEPIADGLDTQTGSIAIAIAVQNLLWGFSQPVAGAISDRFGAARTLAGGGVLYLAAMLLLAQASAPGMVLVSGGFVTGVAIGVASFAVVLSAVGKMAPPEKRSLYLGIVSAVGSLGQFVLVPITQWHLDRNDWSDTVVVLGLVAAVIVLVAPFMTMSRVDVGPADTGLGDDAASGGGAAPEPGRTLRQELRRAGHSRSYLMLNGAFFVCGFHVTFIGVFLPGYAEDGGLSPSTASTALALIGLFNVAGSLIVGVLGQRMRFTTVLAWIYGLRAVVIAGYILVPLSATSTIVFSMGMGLLWLATVPMTSAIVTQQFGPAHAGALFGIVFLSHRSWGPSSAASWSTPPTRTPRCGGSPWPSVSSRWRCISSSTSRRSPSRRRRATGPCRSCPPGSAPWSPPQGSPRRWRWRRSRPMRSAIRPTARPRASASSRPQC